MKKILSALVLTAIGYCALAQNLKSNLPAGNPEVAPAPGEATSTSYVNARAAKNFQKMFKSVKNEQWFEMPDGYRATFNLSDVRYRLDYDKSGNWTHTIRYYDAKRLPVDVRTLIAGTYLDHTIRTVEEIEAPKGNLFYVIHLESQSEWVNVKVADGEIYVLEKINKS